MHFFARTVAVKMMFLGQGIKLAAGAVMPIRKIIIALGLITILPSTVYAQSVDEVYFMTETYPPYNFEDNGSMQGIAVDLLALMLKKVGSRQSRASIRLVPWARGYRNLLKKKNTCLFSMTRTDERESLFRWVGPIASTTVSLIAKKDKKIKIKEIKDVEKYVVGTVIDDVGEQLVLEGGIALKALDRIAGLEVITRSIKKLNADRINIWSYDLNVAKWELRLHGFDPANYEAVYTLKKADLYFAFHKETSDQLVKKLQSALDKIKKDGTYEKILGRYLK